MSTALALAAALVSATYGGNISIQRNLSDNECAEARSIALFGKTIEAKAADDKAAADALAKYESEQRAAQAKWEADNPKAAAKCHSTETSAVFVTCGPNIWAGPPTVTGGWTEHYPGDIKYAECVKP